ncbi:MAG: Lrp/AsnC family transcriptional regulator [Gammaproteobacteria bacterium]|nr:Lrp/AsnC family transcriptional regulator [Gammaproteobacteria bacterium]MDH4316360.1 Lrp/AsnC family transcriptional regulator [Gammaproteobacteria bacterium]MDH5215468.1 Lrp/AsnC family transcriptional regulator [Gammaproteobacteria bacterium]MDH5500533.1 Lrp/AsnC family transcriptional regulator [Gammaproteobacteria bacterium]
MDQRDKAILQALQNDATTTVGELAEQTGLSKSACWRRIQQLEELGIIGARVTLLNQEALGLNLTVYTAVKTHEHTRSWFDRFHAVTTSMPNVMEVHRMSGDVDYLIRAVVPDMKSYDNMYKEMISKVNLFDVSSSFSMETIKYTTALPLDYL